eukprot:CAMPEP_0173413780 /NCGR_PEP_ID=MMETSP1356-20130122/82851_1 /TAXON_ID=77927 ORGANISM="Hemiselmis virescens, Strain PCC157" /NCGR_SAMPLE_ID=MMETSP1356 /ASSEMBLY_ACC=CAM_ASM_000847 /LENGTH=36 /DNA_ID= /DNA_START= /DNA_END= /DNA_ORIENTATION=
MNCSSTSATSSRGPNPPPSNSMRSGRTTGVPVLCAS